jgi:nitroimidazol reductase NimA-like FMN-containing flavoprotein (pyridoxamine 5'-phosphate oxidase superfamily)
VPLNFVYVPDIIAFPCALDGRKLEILAQTPHCCFDVDAFQGEVRYHHDSLYHLDYDTVLAFGTARVEHDAERKFRFFDHLHATYKALYRRPLAGGVRFDRARLHEACCVVITLAELTGRRERTVDGRREKTTWRYRFAAR